MSDTKCDLGFRFDHSKFVTAVPLGKDGKPIMCNERVYGDDGRAWIVEGWCSGSYNVIANDPLSKAHKHLKDKWLTHEKPKTKAEIISQMRVEANRYRTSKEWACLSSDVAVMLDSLADELEGANK